ncbi:Transposon Tf2-8 polyprotein [Dictyocoela muelleri]|nr:Transposon Tf2-8 polyprotein [Dictyocoela muelleri]
MTLKDYLNCKNLKKSIIKIINNCITCQTTKGESKIYGFSSGFLFSDKPFEFISSDIFDPLKSIHFKSDNENSYFYLITFTDIYSRLTETYYLMDITSQSIQNALKKWIIKYGAPKRLLTDQGRQYIGSKFKRYLKKYQIKHILTSAYNPTCNGISERLNSKIATICRISRGSSIKELIINIFKGLNIPYHTRLGASPFEMIYKYSIFDPRKQNLHDKIKNLKNKGALLAKKIKRKNQ